jgi:hypothetical protein
MNFSNKNNNNLEQPKFNKNRKRFRDAPKTITSSFNNKNNNTQISTTKLKYLLQIPETTTKRKRNKMQTQKLKFHIQPLVK